jgi:hypothetical protein
VSETICQASYCQHEPLEVLSRKSKSPGGWVLYSASDDSQTFSTLIFLAKKVGTGQDQMGLDWREAKTEGMFFPWLYRIEGRITAPREGGP